MKATCKNLLLFLGILLMTNCKTTKTFPENLNRKWMLIELEDFAKNELMRNNANLDLTNKNHYIAHLGCNEIKMKVEIKNSTRISFSEISRPQKFCENSMKLEESFLSIAPKINQYKVKGHFLSLTTKQGEKIKFVAADWD
jgi:heat shock protein HslJ